MIFEIFTTLTLGILSLIWRKSSFWKSSDLPPNTSEDTRVYMKNFNKYHRERLLVGGIGLILVGLLLLLGEIDKLIR